MRRRLGTIGAVLGILGLFVLVALVVGDTERRATPIGWVPVGAVLAAMVLMGLYTRAACRVEVSLQSDLVDCVRGDAGSLAVICRNRTPLALPSVRLTMRRTDGAGRVVDEHTVLVSIGPFRSAAVDLGLTFDHVGVYAVGVADVEVCDPLGLFRSRLGKGVERVVRVAPRSYPLAVLELSDEALLETTAAAKSVLADSQDYAYVRDYVIGDPLKAVHWKLSARMGSYYTRLYETTTNPGATVVVDPYCPDLDPEEGRALMDAVFESAVSLMAYGLAEGLDIELRFVDRFGERRCLSRWDEDAVFQFVDALPRAVDAAEVREGSIELIRSLVAQGTGQGNLVVCSANVQEDMVGALIEAKLGRRAPLLVAAVPRSLVDRDRRQWCRHLRALDDVGVPCLTVGSADELGEVRS